jgi:hypothetical protein
VSGLSHLYALSGTYTATTTILDRGGSSATETGMTTVADAPLTAGTVTVSGGVEGTTAASLNATFSDADTGAPASDFSGTIDWGDGSAATTFGNANVIANGNGSFTVSGLSHTYAEEGTYNTSVAIDDAGGSAATETGVTTVADAPLTAGTVTVSGGIEGTTAATLNATFSDADTGAPASDFSGTIDWGDGSAATTFTDGNVTPNGNGSFTVSGLSHLYALSGTYTATTTILDHGGSSVTQTGMTTVADAPLTAGTVTVSGGVGGTTAATLNATFSDADTGAPASDFSGTIDWGDGSAATTFTNTNVTANGNGSFTVSRLSHLYALSGTYTATTTILDHGGSSATQTGTATVAHAPPKVSAGGTAVFSVGGAAVPLDSALTVTDPDSGGNLVSATVSIAGGFSGDGDALSAPVGGTNIQANYDSTTETLTLTGSDTLAHYQSVLDGVTFNSGANPTNDGADLTRTVSWVANDGSSSNSLSAPATTNVSFTNVPNAFQNPAFELDAFDPQATGWTSQDTFPRELGDVFGNGPDDIVGFGSNGVYVSQNLGGGNFSSPMFDLAAFGADEGWSSQNSYPRELADVYGNGRDDIVGFASDGVYVSQNLGSGNFAAPTKAFSNFGQSSSAGGWTSQDAYPRELADVYGNGRDDIVAFANDGVYVSQNLGSGNFAAPTKVLSNFGQSSSAGGWTSQDAYPRYLADVTGDGLADIVGFGSDGVYVSRNLGGGRFAAPVLALPGGFDQSSGWTSENQYPRELADINGDGRADIVGFGATGIYYALGQSNGTFGPITTDLNGFGADASAGGWTSQDLYPRLLGDVTGDHKADIVGFGGSGVYVAPAR